MLPTELIGYSDKLSAAPGQTIAFKISTDHAAYEADIVRLIHGDVNGPGFKSEDAHSFGQQVGRKQIAHCGSYAKVEHHAALSLSGSFTLQMWIYPTTPQKDELQGLLSKWSDNSGYILTIDESGALDLLLSDRKGERGQFFSTGKPMRSHQWYFVAATFDAESHIIKLYQLPLSNYPLDDTSAVIERPTNLSALAQSDAHLFIGAVDEPLSFDQNPYNGKIDSPRMFSRALSADEIERLRRDESPADIDGLVAAWDFSLDMASARVTDIGPNGLHGVVVNMPMRAVTGHNWNTSAYDFKHAPAQYGAIHFHDDDLEDAKWLTDFEWRIPEGTKSGFYAARLRSGEHDDYVPFFVRPKRGTASAKAAILVPTLTYLAYANERLAGLPLHSAGITNRPLVKDPLDVYLEQHPEFAMSIYDAHSDGSGCCYSSRLRPIVNMRPNYRMWLVGAPRHLGADLYLVDWLEAQGFDYDVITDEDLHHEGVELLSNYRVVMSGMHPEYWTTPMLSALESYLGNGGRLMSMGANGYYWVTAIDPERPHIVEVRRGNSGTPAWNSAPGEQYHSATGEMGGLWRHRGKSPNQIAGVGFTGDGWHSPTPAYTRQPGSFDERAAFIFDGIAPDEIIGNFGLVLGGAAGDEMDRLDFALGSPPHTLLLATASNYSRQYMPVIEDLLELSTSLLANQDPRVRADMTYFETPNGGAVFSVGSITWCGSLSHNDYNNNVSRITANVLRAFSLA